MGLLDALRDKGFWQDVGSNARDVAQGASNAIASNVSAPVDGLAWLLRKGGVPVPENPVGGSDWMAQQGLTAQPKNHLAGLLGEVAGGVAPMVMGAYAPKIANGLLQMGGNALAPKTLNSQTGAVVWHGSPHKFDAFDSSKIGAGEGSQAYGHGLYFAESPKTAEWYKDTLKLSNASTPRTNGEVIAAKAIEAANGDKTKAIELMTNGAIDGSKIPEFAARSAVEKMHSAVADKSGSLYKVDLPDEHIAKMLDWDKPLSQQAPEVQKALQSHGIGGDAWSEITGPNLINQLGQRLDNKNTSIAASQALQKQGIPGIRYLDGGSRIAGAGSSNYVIFPGNENLLQILERNGQPVNSLLNK